MKTSAPIHVSSLTAMLDPSNLARLWMRALAAISQAAAPRMRAFTTKDDVSGSF